MRYFRKYQSQIRKPETAATALRRCVDVLRREGLGEALLSYRFEDMSFGKSSGIERIQKAYPTLDLNVSVAGKAPDLDVEMRDALSSTEDTVGSGTAEVLCEVFEGIARRFPLSRADVFIHEIPWSVIAPVPDAAEVITPEGPHREWLGAINVTNDWWISKRQQSFSATIEVQPDAKGKAQEVPAAARALLTELGAPRTSRVVVHLTDAERDAVNVKKAQAAAVMQRYDAALAELARTLKFPHELPHPNEANERMAFPPEPVGSYKPALLEVFEPLGYRYQSSRSGNGGFTLTKTSPGGHEIELFLDVGSYSRTAGGWLGMNGPGWMARALLAITPWEDNYGAYPIVDADVWRKIVENMREAVEYYEGTFVPEIDAIYA